MPKWQGYSWEIKHGFYPWILQLKQVRASLDFPSLNKTKTGQNFCDFNKGLNTLSDFKRSQYSNTSALKWQEKRAAMQLQLPRCCDGVCLVLWVGQASLPAGASLQVLPPVQQNTRLGDGHLFSGPHVQSWPALLQSVGLAGATHMQQPEAGSGSVGSRTHVSHTDLVQKALLWQKRYGRGGCEPCEGTVKNPAEFAVSILRVPTFWWRPSPTTLFT